MLRSIIFITYIAYAASDDGYSVQLSSNSPVLRGGTVNFQADVFYYDERPKDKFKYEWLDSSITQNRKTVETTSNIDTWNVTYSANVYPPGPYVVQVTLYVYRYLWYSEVTSQRLIFNLTDTLNGQIDFIQNNKTLKNNFVSNAVPLNHTIDLKKSDADYLRNRATSIKSFWFVDCNFFGVSDDLTFVKRYNNSNEEHSVEVVVVAGFEPITTVAPPTTTPSTNVTTLKPNTSKSTPETPITKQKVLLMPNQNATKPKRSLFDKSSPFNTSIPTMCNNTVVPLGPNYTYGLFKSDVNVRAPISNITITGNNWLEHGDILTLNVKCTGSGLFNYCIHFYSGKYNTTGNETCMVPDTSEKCEFSIKRYFIEAKIYTVVVVITNQIDKVVYPVVVTVYEVTKQAQLSVIAIPVAFSSIAIILIVFGVAYYMQNRSRFVVEVADFDFGRNYTDMEYMTFKERLLDAISNALSRAPSRSTSEVPVWPPGKYGSMK